MKKDFYPIAVIMAPHGLKGEVKLKFFGDDVALLKKYGCLWIDDTRFLTIQAVKQSKPGLLIARFEGIDTRDLSEGIVKTMLYIKHNQLIPLKDDDTFYQQELIGCAVFCGAENLGPVLSVDNYGGDDILELGAMRVFFKKVAILQVDLEARTIYVNPDYIVWDAL